MHKNLLQQPTIIYFLGMPGSGKSFISRQLSHDLSLAHVGSDRLRHELFDTPRFDKPEHDLITRLMDFVTEEFLTAGVSVLYDISLSRSADRRSLRELARKYNAKELLVWVQTDVESGWARSQNHDRRRADDKYSAPITREVFDQYVRIMQNPHNEQYVVVSGKHSYDAQKTTIMRRLSEMGVLNLEALEPYIPKPEMVNLVSRAQAQAGRVDLSRRNINIR